MCASQAHFSRTPLGGDLRADQRGVVATAMRLLHALVDVVSSNSHLALCLTAMELCQMTAQAQWDSDSPLLQVPGFTPQLAKRCEAAGAPLSARTCLGPTTCAPPSAQHVRGKRQSHVLPQVAHCSPQPLPLQA